MQPRAKPPRPRGVIALGTLAILIGLFGIAGGTALFLNAGMIFAALDALLAVVIGVLYVAAGIGFFRGKGWAWVLGIIVSIVEHPAAHAYGIPGTIVAVIVIYYLTRSHVKVFFGRGGKQTNFCRENEQTKT
jgi:hypothetical protein